ncbi:MAG: hypothetical protein BroJett011_13650 [Chloroflexota bacterium]|nr:MAG: hypothetical protein BroJett011_13650 [Chloroflexota bacterium]
MKQLFVVLMLVMVVSLSTATAAWADHGKPPIRGCPKSFDLHDIHHHNDDHEHRHIGSDADRNGDGWLCVKDLGDKHLHIDNNKPK